MDRRHPSSSFHTNAPENGSARARARFTMPSGYTPTFRISRGGVDVTSNFNDRLVSLSVEHSNLDFADRVEIVLDDRDWRIASPSPGETIAVDLGYREIGLAFQGVFQIEEVIYFGPPRSIQISGSSVALSSTIAAPVIAAFEAQTVGQIVTKLAESAGLTATVHPAVATLAIPFRNTILSPLGDIGELARLAGAVAKVTDGRVVLVPRDAGISVSGSVVPIVRLGPDHFGSWTVRHANRTEHSEVEASYFDADAQVRKWVSFGPEGSAFPNIVAGSNPFKIGQLFSTEAEALSAAKSKMAALVRGSGQFLGTLAQGDPWLMDQQRLEVSGMREGIDGSYTIASIRHTYDAQGLQTSIEANPSGIGEDFAAMESLDNFLIPQPGEPIGRLLVGANGQIAGGV